MLSVFGSLLLEGHILPKSMYESRKLLRALKMPNEQIYACPKGCILFSKEHVKSNYCPKCGSFRYVEEDLGDGNKKQSKTPVKILRYLPFTPRMQQLYMTEETTKQMTWRKNDTRYHPDKMIHPPDGESWIQFNQIHSHKDLEACNVRIGLATDDYVDICDSCDGNVCICDACDGYGEWYHIHEKTNKAENLRMQCQV